MANKNIIINLKLKNVMKTKSKIKHITSTAYYLLYGRLQLLRQNLIPNIRSIIIIKGYNNQQQLKTE